MLEVFMTAVPKVTITQFGLAPNKIKINSGTCLLENQALGTGLRATENNGSCFAEPICGFRLQENQTR
jgi:hypothetical protein